MTQREIGNITPVPKREELEKKLSDLASLSPLTEGEQKSIAIEAAVNSAFMFSDDVDEKIRSEITRKLENSVITKPESPDL